MKIYNAARVGIVVMLMVLRNAVQSKAGRPHRSLRHLLTNNSDTTVELIEPTPPLPTLSTLNCWLDPNNLKYVCLSDVEDKSGNVAEKCSKKSSLVQLLAVRCWCTLTVLTNEESNGEQFMHHCVSCSRSEISNTSTTSEQNSDETLYDCRHIHTDGFFSYAYNGIIPSNNINDNDSLFFDAASEASDEAKSSRQSAVPAYEDTIVIEPLQDVVILTVENATATEDDVVLEQGTTTGGAGASKGSKQPRPPKLPQR